MNLSAFRFFAVATFLLLGGSLIAQPPASKALPVPRPPEITPETLPGAESHIFRDLKPDPLRLHVFKPKDWKAGDKRAGFVWFFGGGWSHGLPSSSFAKWAADLGFVGIAPDYRTFDRF